MGSPTLGELDRLYKSGLCGGFKRSNLGPSQSTYLDPEEEENFRQEDRRSSRYRQAERVITTQDLEEFVKTLPPPLPETDEHREIRRLKERRRRRRVSPSTRVRQPSNWSLSGTERESLKRAQAERVKTWLQNQ